MCVCVRARVAVWLTLREHSNNTSCVDLLHEDSWLSCKDLFGVCDQPLGQTPCQCLDSSVVFRAHKLPGIGKTKEKNMLGQGGVVCNPRSTESTRAATRGRPRAAAAMLISPERGKRKKSKSAFCECCQEEERQGTSAVDALHAVSRNIYRCMRVIRQACQSSFKRKGYNLIQKGKPKPKEGDGGEKQGVQLLDLPLFHHLHHRW